MPDTLIPAADRTVTSAHNAPPLAELLADETAELRNRANELAAAAGRAFVEDEDSAGRAVTLAKMLKDHARKVDDARKARKEPYLEAGRTVDAVFGGIKDAVDKATAAVVAMVDSYRREQQRRQDEERRRLEANARAKAEEAARAAAAAQQSNNVDAEVQAQIVAAEAARAQAQAQELAAPAQVRSDYGAMATGRKETVVTVTDPKALALHFIKHGSPELLEALATIAKRQVKAGVTLPGVTVETVTKTVIR